MRAVAGPGAGPAADRGGPEPAPLPALLIRRGAAPTADARTLATSAAEADIVRAKLAAGALRKDPCVGGLVAAFGSRLACEGCDRPIAADEVEMRPSFADGGALRFHARCFAVWHAQTESWPRD